MKKLILSGLVAIGLVSLLTGCMSEDEKKAKKIMVENTIKDDGIAKAYKQVTGKDIPNDEFSMINEDRKKLDWIRNNYELIENSKNNSWILELEKNVNQKKNYQDTRTNAFGN